MVALGGARQTKYSTKPEAQRRIDLAGFLFVLPFLVFYVAFLVWPVILGLRMSFFNWSLVGTGTGQFLGVSNYGELFTDPDFWSSLWHSILFTLLTVPLLTLLSLGFALLANRAIPARWFFRLSFFAPYVLPSSVMALIWIWMYQPGFGLINSYLTQLGLSEVSWLTDPQVAMISVVIATVWWQLGFSFVLYLAGLQEIPRELYDAAAVDGASSLETTRFITIPLLKRTTILVVTLAVFASLNVFDQIYIMSTSGGLDYQSTRSLIMYVYEQGFTLYRVGYAAAMTYVFFVLVLVVSITGFVFSNRRREA
ncbi:sugar ABC transporter permease [Rubrobacter taiwanensis]|jgi:multiple sugar transport system permease protein|uniref:Sugar ABC transporter permease n=1 Tax=Rubrobacter taiwanensis TaxID=185139 RepID=A0A4R1BQK4_9ACTN|nr:sugar ABC transporter permease [Rubrobacter taiwanensis]TCJ19881.1 sugar ABC transporter permease [Rubrobacter taiwanensis]